MRQIDPAKSIEDSLLVDILQSLLDDPIHSLTHPDMRDWNYCPTGIGLQGKLDFLLMKFGADFFKEPPRTATEAVMLEESKNKLYCDKKHLEMLKPRYKLDDFLTKDWM